VRAVCVAPRTVAVEQLLPLHHVVLAAVSLDQRVKVIDASTAALGALDTEYIELASMSPKTR
jgi:hypothetical protein